jgi:hypothetical protein
LEAKTEPVIIDKKGELLFDDTSSGKKKRIHYKIDLIMTGIGMFGLTFFAYVVLIIKMQPDNFLTHIVAYFIMSVFIFIGVLFFIAAYMIQPINVYQNGISGLRVELLDLLKSRITIIPFAEMEIIYLNMKKPKKWITIILRDGTKTHHYKDEFGNIEKFTEICSKHVRISNDDDPI